MQFEKRKLKILSLLSIALFVLVGGVEIYLRLVYGFCDAVLMKADDDFEYIAQPNQKRKRFGNTILYNEYSMRSGPIRPDALKILCVGDSIVNGGTLSDHSNLATSILENRLSSVFKRDIQVLNISAGSWGPDNCAAYLERHGTFQASMLILVTSSHDAFDTMTFIPVVGRTKDYPTRQYPLAILELLDRYLCRNNKIYHLPKDQIDAEFRKEHNITRNDNIFNPGFEELLKIARRENIPFVVYLHAEQKEFQDGKYNREGNLILDFAEKNGIPVISDLKCGLQTDWFRDPIHYNDKGQKEMAKLLLNYCQKHFEAGK